jgi:hypothetical protein
MFGFLPDRAPLPPDGSIDPRSKGGAMQSTFQLGPRIERHGTRRDVTRIVLLRCTTGTEMSPHRAIECVKKPRLQGDFGHAAPSEGTADDRQPVYSEYLVPFLPRVLTPYIS